MPMNLGTVFIVDDEESARDSVAALMRSLGLATANFASAEQFLAEYDARELGCVVTDLRMIDMSGLDLQASLQARGSTIPVIMLTAHADVPMVVRSMQAGAVTVLEKPCDSQTLQKSVMHALTTNMQLHETLAKRAETQQHLAELTDEERSVLDFILDGQPNKVIARRLDVGLRTVEGRRHNIFKKMHCDSLAELVRKITESRVGTEGATWDPSERS